MPTEIPGNTKTENKHMNCIVSYVCTRAGMCFCEIVVLSPRKSDVVMCVESNVMRFNSFVLPNIICLQSNVLTHDAFEVGWVALNMFACNDCMVVLFS